RPRRLNRFWLLQLISTALIGLLPRQNIQTMNNHRRRGNLIRPRRISPILAPHHRPRRKVTGKPSGLLQPNLSIPPKDLSQRQAILAPETRTRLLAMRLQEVMKRGQVGLALVRTSCTNSPPASTVTRPCSLRRTAIASRYCSAPSRRFRADGRRTALPFSSSARSSRSSKSSRASWEIVHSRPSTSATMVADRKSTRLNSSHVKI